MKTIYQSGEELVVLADNQTKAPPGMAMVDFVRKTQSGVWEVWQHGSRHKDSLVEIGESLP